MGELRKMKLKTKQRKIPDGWKHVSKYKVNMANRVRKVQRDNDDSMAQKEKQEVCANEKR